MPVATKAKRQSGVRLSGVLPLTKLKKPRCPKDFRELLVDIKQVRDSRGSLSRLGNDEQVFTDAQARANAMITDLIKDQFADRGQLSDELLKPREFNVDLEFEQRDPSAEQSMSQTPRALLSDLRRIADDLGFLIIPFPYLSRQAGHKGSEVELLVENFTGACYKLDLQAYVLSPPIYYGIEEHARASDPNIQGYDGRHGVLMTMTRQNVLTFRGVFETLRDLSQQVSSVGRRVSDAEQALRQMQGNMEGLEQEVRRMQFSLLATREAFAADISALSARVQSAELKANRAERHAAAAMQMILCMLDPLMFAVPSETNVAKDDTAAYVGPCWGPDFPLIMARAYVNGAFDPTARQKDIESQIKRIWS